MTSAGSNPEGGVLLERGRRYATTSLSGESTLGAVLEF
jgi:hypothetical protein